jgi:hypothetical protein
VAVAAAVTTEEPQVRGVLAVVVQESWATPRRQPAQEQSTQVAVVVVRRGQLHHLQAAQAAQVS